MIVSSPYTPVTDLPTRSASPLISFSPEMLTLLISAIPSGSPTIIFPSVASSELAPAFEPLGLSPSSKTWPAITLLSGAVFGIPASS